MAAPRIVKTADARAAGLTRGRLRGRCWHAAFHGVRIEVLAADASAVSELATRCRALLELAPPGSAIGGLTAARLRGWWLPKSSMDTPIEITVPPPYEVRRPGVRCRRARLAAADVTVVDGLRLTSPLRTLLDLAASQPLIDLVVLADAALYFKHCTVDELTSTAFISGRRGAQRFRRMLGLIDPLSESPMESLLRLVVVLSGLPRPESQVNIFSDFGEFVARGDLKVPSVKAIFEYDGRDHDEPARHAGDVRRWRALHEAGYQVFPYTANDLFQRPAQIVTDYQRVLGLPIDARSVRGWLQEWRLSGYR